MLPDVQRGILGGTFDPPHLAHLFGGEAAHGDLGLDVVTFVPAGSPWQKADRVVSDPRHRLAMVERATTDVGYFDVDDQEVHRSGWTYTIDTLESFPDDDVTLVVGADAARNIPTWHRSTEVLERVRLAVLPRPGVSREEVAVALPGADVVWLDAPAVDVSGTAIRTRVAAGLSVRFLVAEPVRQYIGDNGLYR